MVRILLLQILERSSSIPPPPTVAQTLPSPSSPTINLDSKITPSILLIIVILAIIFFVSGLLHLLVRFLLRPNTRSPDESNTVTALQGQLQQLFHLHDAGVDQSFIDTLPVFHYKAIIGVKDPFDCAVCLCEFEPEDKLRLLPKCSHAFHMDCIDTWLLSHSTCPLCRASLIPEFSGQGNFTSPIVCVLESGSDTSREIGGERDGPGFVRHSSNSVLLGESNSFMGIQRDGESGSDDRMIDFPRKSISQKEEAAVNACGGGVTVPISVENSGEKIVMVKLGKFKNVDGSGEGSSETTNKMSTSRRCYSMGSFAYVMDERCSLQVPIGKTPPAGAKKPKKPGFLPLKPGHRSAVSEYGSDSRREFNGLEAFKSIEIHDAGGWTGIIGSSSADFHEPTSKSERFSISKIWARGGKKESNKGGGNGSNVNRESSKRVFSSRFAGRQSVGGGGSVLGDVSRRTISEIETDEGLEYDGGGSWLDDQETHSCYSVDSQAMMPSSSSSSATRRTLLWLMGRQQNKVLQLPQHLRNPSCSNV